MTYNDQFDIMTLLPIDAITYCTISSVLLYDYDQYNFSSYSPILIGHNYNDYLLLAT
jgi:hypothetical protein